MGNNAPLGGPLLRPRGGGQPWGCGAPPGRRACRRYIIVPGQPLPLQTPGRPTGGPWKWASLRDHRGSEGREGESSDRGNGDK